MNIFYDFIVYNNFYLIYLFLYNIKGLRKIIIIQKGLNLFSPARYSI